MQKELKNNQARLKEDEWRSCEHKLIQYRTEWTATREMVEELLQKRTSIDKALMKYHNEKMSRVNTSLRDLWRVTYKGTDIDRIEITSDSDTMDENRYIKNYNYRVTMITTDNVKMDMKGRCSAGQKVLASFIIRLALAENFASNCSVMALDEPTTNLDEPNIANLCEALKAVIFSKD